MRTSIIGTGTWLPQRVVKNIEVTDGDEALAQDYAARTGIVERRYADDDATVIDMACAAAEDLIGRHWNALKGVRAVLVGGSTPQIAEQVRDRLDVEAPAIDVTLTCTSALYALDRANKILTEQDDREGRVLIVCTDLFSRMLDPADMRTRFIMGDGAGALLVGAVGDDERGIRAFRDRLDQQLPDLVYVPGLGPTNDGRFFRMDGRAIKDYIMSSAPGVVAGACADAGVTLADIDHVVIHQANPGLVRKVADSLDIPPDKVAISGDLLGNTAAASVPLTLAQSMDCKNIRPGNTVLLIAVSYGMRVAAMIYDAVPLLSRRPHVNAVAPTQRTEAEA